MQLEEKKIKSWVLWSHLPNHKCTRIYPCLLLTSFLLSKFIEKSSQRKSRGRKPSLAPVRQEFCCVFYLQAHKMNILRGRASKKGSRIKAGEKGLPLRTKLTVRDPPNPLPHVGDLHTSPSPRAFTPAPVTQQWSDLAPCFLPIISLQRWFLPPTNPLSATPNQKRFPNYPIGEYLLFLGRLTKSRWFFFLRRHTR